MLDDREVFDEMMTAVGLSIANLAKELSVSASSLYGAKSKNKIQKWVLVYLKLKIENIRLLSTNRALLGELEHHLQETPKCGG